MENQILENALEIWAAYGHNSQFPVRGTSMVPLIQPGDIVEVTHGVDEFPMGAILAYRSKDGVVIHRFCGLLPKGKLRMAGDRHNFPDFPVYPEAILGKVIRISSSEFQYDLEGFVARVSGWVLAYLSPLRKLPGVRRIPQILTILAARIIRR